MDITSEKIEEARQIGLRPEVVGCFIHGRKILLFYKKEYDLWQLPQGGIESGETISKAVNREMAEELGADFAARAKTGEVFAEDQIVFSEDMPKDRIIKDDDGRQIPMKGKKYFFVKMGTSDSALDISKTEFDSYRWVDYEAAMSLVGGIRQQGKKRIIMKAIEELRKQEWL